MEFEKKRQEGLGKRQKVEGEIPVIDSLLIF
jgi:hypothetical protein